MDWIIRYGYLIWAVVCLVSVITCWLHYRRNPGAKGAKLFFKFFPYADSTGETPSGLTPRAIVLVVVGLLIILIANILFPGAS